MNPEEENMIGYKIIKRMDDSGRLLFEIWKDEANGTPNSWKRISKWTEKPKFDPPSDHQ